ncbi:sugar phosphate isomerase/epimerase family protein [Clostridium grantii]|uniref:Sugar phosphate isomerase/epimerase n=1 Tax=Clostridium grantii DSM 8605 TaxID=1121316 RepID=A0A1M5T4C6_9CLOT|nr:sugar phosphate isomerase/epimerase family protein [Clostridium grantii]SHH45595.1 Sugar phosphate isomerase/epimerase [Clostridium grantii DSM 8605]
MVKIGICAWVLPIKEEDVFEFASSIGFQGVDIDLGKNNNGFKLEDKDLQAKYLQLAEKYDVEICTLALNTMCDKNYGMSHKENFENVKAVFDIGFKVAKEMGVKTIQIPSFFDGKIEDTQQLEQTIECLKYASYLGEKYDIFVGTENGVSTEDNLIILEKVNSNKLFIYYDTQNPYRFSALDNVKIAEDLHKYVREIHAKDSFPDGSIELYLGQGDTRFKEAIKVFAENDFNGWIQLESEYKKYPNYLEIIKADYAMLKKTFEKS